MTSIERGTDRAEIVAILAAYGDRSPESVPERIASLELAWLVHQLEQRHGLSFGDDDLTRMSTVTAAVEVVIEARDRGSA